MSDVEKAARFREQADRLRGLITPEELVKERAYDPLAELLETVADMLDAEKTPAGEESQRPGLGRRAKG
jgi:hypothetical protein